MQDTLTIEEGEKALAFAATHRDAAVMRVVSLILLEATAVHGDFLKRLLAHRIPDSLILANVFETMGLSGRLADLLDMLIHESPHVRWAAAEALGRVGDPAAISGLTAALNDSVELVRFRAKQSIHAIQHSARHDSHSEVLQGLIYEERLVARVIVGSNIRADDAVRLMRHSHAAIRMKARDALKKLGPDAAPSVFALLESSNGTLSPELIEVLGDLRDSRAMSYLRYAHLKGEKHLHTDAIRALQNIGDAEAIEEILTYWKHAEAVSRTEAEKSLEALGPRAYSALRTMLQGKNRLRGHEIELLAKVGGALALEVLVASLHERYRETREAARKGLERIGGSAVTPLIHLLESEEEIVRHGAALALGNIGESAAEPALLRMSRSNAPLDRRVAIEALGTFSTEATLERLAQVMSGPDREERKRAVRALGRLDDHSALELLRQAFKDNEPRIRLEAIRSFEQLGRKQETYAKEATEALIKMLRDPGMEVASWAATALVNIGFRHRGIIEVIDRAALEAKGRGNQELNLFLNDVKDRLAKKNAPHFHLAEAISVREAPPPPVTLEMPQKITDYVHFSVTAPQSLARGSSFILDLWVHLEHERGLVLDRAKRYSNRQDMKLRSKGPIKVERGSIMHVRLNIPDWRLDSKEDIIYWTGDIGNASFPVNVPNEVEIRSYLGWISVCANGFEISTVHFTLDIVQEKVDVESEDVTTREERVNSAYASYASEDRDQVLGRIQGMLKILPGIDIFIDVATLRSGDNWEQRIEQEIIERDIFYLFWSIAASRSPWVAKEWRTALLVKGLGFIDPIPLEPPSRVPPPPELASLHFNDWTLAFEHRHGMAWVKQFLWSIRRSAEWLLHRAFRHNGKLG